MTFLPALDLAATGPTLALAPATCRAHVAHMALLPSLPSLRSMHGTRALPSCPRCTPALLPMLESASRAAATKQQQMLAGDLSAYLPPQKSSVAAAPGHHLPGLPVY